MTSYFGTVIVPEATASSPKIFFGVPEGRLRPIEEAHYRKKKNLSTYNEITANGDAAQLSDHDFLTYVIESTQYLHLGDRVELEGEELVVAESVARMDRGILTYDYVLAHEAGIRQSPIHNPYLTGASLEGRIIEVRGDAVRIHLDIDADQTKNTASWFPYSSAYSSKDGAGFTCMPQEGDSIKLYFPTIRENEAIAMSSVRKGGATSLQSVDPSMKLWGTPHGKEMRMTGREMSFTAKGGLFLKLDQEDGITLQSDTSILIQSSEDIEFESEKNIEFKAEEAIYLYCDTSSIMLEEGDTEIQGNEVQVEGLIKGPVEVADIAYEPPPEPEKKGWLDKLQSGLDIVGMIPGVGVETNFEF